MEHMVQSLVIWNVKIYAMLKVHVEKTTIGEIPEKKKSKEQKQTDVTGMQDLFPI